jgi:UDP-glucose 4-epimerase
MAEHILVIGGEGFIGRSLCGALAHSGYRVTSASRSMNTVQDDAIERVACDIRSPGDVAPLLENCDFVVHLASGSTPSSTAGKPVHEIDANLQPTLGLLQAMQSQPALPLLFLSSAGSIYDSGAASAFKETDEVRPRSYHGAGKVAAEQFIGAWSRQFGRSAVILRPSNVYGPGQCKQQGFGIVPHAMQALLNNQSLTVWGDGSTARDYLYIDDLVALCMAIIAVEMVAGVRIFNAGSGVAVSLNQLLETMEQVAGRKLQRLYEPMRSVDAERVAVDSSLAQQTFRWQPRIPLMVGLERTWNWSRSAQQ